MTMTEMELAVEQLKGDSGDQGIEAMLRRMKPEKPTGKACPKCGKRTPVKARDRERTVRSLSGPVTFKRNYHYCEECKYGFYPVDRLLRLRDQRRLRRMRCPLEPALPAADLREPAPTGHRSGRCPVRGGGPSSAAPRAEAESGAGGGAGGRGRRQHAADPRPG